jgi:hypothetical protein
VIGGLAASILGNPRTTKDIDILASLDESQWERFLREAERLDFVPRREDCIAFAQCNRVLQVRHSASGVDVDVVLSGMPFEEHVISRAQTVSVGSATVPVATREDLIVMKAVASRPRDVGDIESLLQTAVQIDWDYVLHWVDMFSAALDQPDILGMVQGFRERYGRL